MTKSNFKISHFSEVTVITSPKIVTKITPKDFPFWAPSNQNFWLRHWRTGINE